MPHTSRVERKINGSTVILMDIYYFVFTIRAEIDTSWGSYSFHILMLLIMQGCGRLQSVYDVMVHHSDKNLVNISSDNGSLSDSTNPLVDQMMVHPELEPEGQVSIEFW